MSVSFCKITKVYTLNNVKFSKVQGFAIPLQYFYVWLNFNNIFLVSNFPGRVRPWLWRPAFEIKRAIFFRKPKTGETASGIPEATKNNINRYFVVGENGQNIAPFQ